MTGNLVKASAAFLFIFAFSGILPSLRITPVAVAQTSDPATVTGSVESTGQMRAMFDRVRRLEDTLETLQRAVYSGAPIPDTSVSALPENSQIPVAEEIQQAEAELLFDRVLMIEGDVRAMTGHYEVLDHKMNSMAKRLDRLVVDLDFRLRTIEDRLRAQPDVVLGEPVQGEQFASPTTTNVQDADPGGVKVLGTVTQEQLAATPLQSTSQGQPANLLPVEGDVEDRYAAAMEYVRQGRLNDAERALDEFLAAHPNDPLASNAHYWKAESIYARKDFERAAAVFLSGYQAFPEGRKAPDMLLKLSKSLAALGINDQACATLNQLNNAFPDAPEKIRRRADNDFNRLQCAAVIQ